MSVERLETGEVFLTCHHWSQDLVDCDELSEFLWLPRNVSNEESLKCFEIMPRIYAPGKALESCFTAINYRKKCINIAG